MLTPRRFISIRRTIDPDTNIHTLDAIADDGSAWWMMISEEAYVDGWNPHDPLPSSSPPD